MANIRISIKRNPSKRWNSVSNLLESGPFAKPFDEPLPKKKKKSSASAAIKKNFSLRKYTEKEAKMRVQLFQAAGMGNVDQVEFLLQSGLVDVNATDYDLVTALHRAAKYCQIEAVMALLSRGADPNMTDLKNGLTPLHWLIVHSDPKFHSKEFEQCLVALVAAGADMNRGDFNGVTPLHCAVGHNYKACAKLLVRLGADPLTKDHLGCSPSSVATNDMYKLMKTIVDIETSHTLGRRLSLRRKSVDMW